MGCMIFYVPESTKGVILKQIVKRLFEGVRL